MIIRLWQGMSKNEHELIYTEIIEQRDLPAYKETEGFIKLSFLKRSDEKYTYFKLLTYWTDFEAVRNFAGPNFAEALSYAEDEAYLSDFPGRVEHYESFADVHIE